ncbi:MAG TPA: LCP family protein [Egibacteraceae bacterium]|jgi:polyisoprenyl-teichoic acid--peptidoglycan teichoic acid transferase|nr:LCP family protein [Egibacteraceae bacterium]
MRRLALAVVVAGCLLGLAASAFATAALRASVHPAHAQDGLLTILAIGSDIGPPHRPGDPLHGRADGVHLIAVDATTRRATIVNIPRDASVGGQKLSDLLYYLGPDAFTARVAEFAGVRIDYWALMTFRSIEDVVDGLGGVDVHIPQPMHDAFSGSKFPAGPQRLAGHQALAYVRDRKSVAGGDFGRSANHGNLMRFAHAQVRGNVTNLPELGRMVALFARNTVTNIPRSELLPLARLALMIEPGDVRQTALQGTFGFGPGGASVVHVQPGDAFDRIRAGQVGP